MTRSIASVRPIPDSQLPCPERRGQVPLHNLRSAEAVRETTTPHVSSCRVPQPAGRKDATRYARRVERTTTQENHTIRQRLQDDGGRRMGFDELGGGKASAMEPQSRPSFECPRNCPKSPETDPDAHAVPGQRGLSYSVRDAPTDTKWNWSEKQERAWGSSGRQFKSGHPDQMKPVFDGLLYNRSRMLRELRQSTPEMAARAI